MTTSLQRTQGTQTYKLLKTNHTSTQEIHYLESELEQHPCPCCGSTDTSFARTGKYRDIKGLFIGFKKRFYALFNDVFVVNLAVKAL